MATACRPWEGLPEWGGMTYVTTAAAAAPQRGHEER